MTNFIHNIAAFYLVGGSSDDEETRCITPESPLVQSGWCAQADAWNEEIVEHGFMSCIISNPWGRTTLSRDDDRFGPMEFDALLRARNGGMAQLSNEVAMHAALTALVMQGIGTTIYVGDVARCDYVRRAFDDRIADCIVECLGPLLSAPVSIGWDAIVNLDPDNSISDDRLFTRWDMLRAVKESQRLMCYVETIPRPNDWQGWSRYPVIASQSMVQRHMDTAAKTKDLTVLLHLCDDGDKTRDGMIKNSQFALSSGWKVALPPHYLQKYSVTLDELCPPAPVSKPDERCNCDATQIGGEL